MWRAAGLLAIFAQNTAVFAQKQTQINLPVKLDNNDTKPMATLLTDIVELKLDTADYIFIGIKSCESSLECENAEQIRTQPEDADGLNLTVSTVGKKTFKVEVSSKKQGDDVNADVNLDVYTGLSEANLKFPNDLFSARKNEIAAKSDKSFCEITKVHPDVEIEISQEGSSPADISGNLIVENKTVTAGPDEFGLVTVRRNYRFKDTSLLASETKYSLKCVVSNYVPEGVTDLADSEKTLENVKDLNITEFVDEGPPEIISFGTSNGENLSHGAAGTIRCEVTAMPEAKVTIHRKNGKKWENIDSLSREQVGNKMTADYAILEVDIADHFGSYKCEANSDFQDSAVVDETFVKVTREFGDAFKATTSDAGVGTVMNCKTQAYPKPIKMYWRAKGTESNIDAKTKFTYDDKTATANINYASTKVGSYECVMKATKDSAALVVLYSVNVEDKPIMSKILSNPTYYIIVGSIILLLIISVLVIVMLKRRSSGPPNSEAAHPDVASTTVAASSDHDMEKGNVNDDKGGTGEQAALMKNEV